MTKVDIRQTTHLKFSTSAEEISRWLRTVPPVARISVNRHAGDRGEVDSFSLTASWTGDVDE